MKSEADNLQLIHFCNGRIVFPSIGEHSNIRNDSNFVAKLPALWPTSHDMEIPQWFKMGTDDLQVWLTIDAIPHTSQFDGKEIPCGYKRATGILIGRHITTGTTYIFDFSTQWYRVGCGG